MWEAWGCEFVGLLLWVGQAKRDNGRAEDESENTDSALYMWLNFAKQTVNFQVCQVRQISEAKRHDEKQMRKKKAGDEKTRNRDKKKKKRRRGYNVEKLGLSKKVNIRKIMVGKYYSGHMFQMFQEGD